MKYLILVSHGGLAEGLKTSLAMFAGDKLDQVIAVGLKEGKSVDDFAVDFRESISGLTADDSVLVLADIVGGSPLTTAATVLEEAGKLDGALILGGMNLTMALTAVVMKDVLDGDDLSATILSEARSALQPFEVSATGAEEDDDLQVEKIISTAGAPETDDIQIIAYPDTNSLLVKGTVSQVDFIEKLVATLDIPKRHIELSLWIIDIDKTDLEQLGADWSGTIKIGSSLSASFNNSGSISTLDGTQFIATIQALAQKRRAAVVARPVVLTQENIPAIFDNNRTFYTKLVGERTAELDEVTYGTMISVLPRFASRNQIELLLNIEDGNEINSDKTNVDDLPQVGRTLISTIARVPQGKSLLIGGYTRDTNTYESRKIPILGSIPFIGKLFGYEGTNANNIVRVFLIEPREIDERMMNNANEAAVDARAITQQMAKNKEINDELLQKWIKTYLNREVVGG